MSFVQDMVVTFEMDHHDALAEMLAFSSASYPIGADGTVTSTASGGRRWDPQNLTAGLTRVAAAGNLCPPSAAAMSISFHDFFAMFSQPYVAELPRAMLDTIASDPSSAAAHQYRRYVVQVLMPGCRYVTNILKAHSAVIVSFKFNSHRSCDLLTKTHATLCP